MSNLSGNGLKYTSWALAGQEQNVETYYILGHASTHSLLNTPTSLSIQTKIPVRPWLTITLVGGERLEPRCSADAKLVVLNNALTLRRKRCNISRVSAEMDRSYLRAGPPQTPWVNAGGWRISLHFDGQKTEKSQR